MTNASSMTAEQLLYRIDLFVDENSSINELIRMLREKRIGGLPVKDKKGNFCGIISVYELFKAMVVARNVSGRKLWYDTFKRGQPSIFVRDLYRRDKVSVKLDTPLEEIVDVMLGKNLHTLPVMDATQKILYGVIGRHDLMWTVFGEAAK